MDQMDELRREIDEIDDGILDLVTRRMEVVSRISEYKREHSLPVLDTAREHSKISALMSRSAEEMKSPVRVLYSLIFELSRSYQDSRRGAGSELASAISAAIENTPRLFPRTAAIACAKSDGDGVTAACEKLFIAPEIMYTKDLDGVFASIESGLCRYGVIPADRFGVCSDKGYSIVRSAVIDANYDLYAARDACASDIDEIFTCERAIVRCGEFLRTLSGTRITCCENNAAAFAAFTASGNRRAAVLSSSGASAGIKIARIAEGLQDAAFGEERFVCISRDLEIYPGADRTALTMVLRNRPGALYKALARFYALGVDLTDIVSRPIPGRSDEMRFDLRLRTSVYSEEFVRLISELSGICERFDYLGSYSEVR